MSNAPGFKDVQKTPAKAEDSQNEKRTRKRVRTESKAFRGRDIAIPKNNNSETQKFRDQHLGERTFEKGRINVLAKTLCFATLVEGLEAASRRPDTKCDRGAHEISSPVASPHFCV